MASSGATGFSRETRLLAATIGISIVVLVVLSRFRFPNVAADARDGASAQPLARLAARAAFDDLSLAIRELSGRVSSSLLVVRATYPPGTSPDPRGVSGGTHLLPALRVRDDVAVVLTGEHGVVQAVVGMAGPITVLARDTVRGLTLVRVPAAPAPVLTIREGQQPLTTPGYLAVTEASEGGTSLRPIFVGRSDGLTDPRWDSPLISVGRSAATDLGAPVFTLDGRLAGLVTTTDGEPALVPAAVVLATVDQLLGSGPVQPGDIGIVTQAMDPQLAAATGVATGAAIVSVQRDGPATAFFPGDVVTAVNGLPVRSPDALRLRVARAAPGSTLTLTVRRDGGFFTAPVTVRARPAPSTAAGGSSPQNAAAAAERPLGVTMRPVQGRGSEIVRVLPDSVGASAGLRTGDVIVNLGRDAAPQPDAIVNAFTALAPARSMLLTVERDGRPRLVAVTR